MDRVRTKPRTTNKRIVGVSLSAVIAAVLLWLFFTVDMGTRRVDRSSLRLDTVQRGDMDIEVSGNGVLLSSSMQWIASQVEGRVSAVHKRAGESVTEGQVVVELSNPELVNAAEEALSALEGARADLVSYGVDLENQILNQKSVALRARFAYESALLKLDAETQLRETASLIADIDYRRTQLEVEQLRASQLIENERLEKSQANIVTQLAAREAKVKQFSKALDRARGKVDALTVRAGMDGVVQQMDLEIGQRLSAGGQIAKIARQDQLYAELKILARRAGEIAQGQGVVVDTRDGVVPGIVSRIDPAVSEGTVVVDVELTGPLPRGARPELQVEGTISIAKLRDTLMVAKPSYGRAGSDISLYRIGEDSSYAERTSVKTGRSSVKKIQILDGLAAGDQIILSDSSDWQKHARILLD
ncbi:MAG: HlyD family efflux transporter periplasmic adaptor subunit [Halioglobus sp.]